jgi:hypothetical protein
VIDADHLDGDLAVGDGLNLQRMQSAELPDLIEGQRCILDEPDRRRLGHQGLHALFSSIRRGYVETGQ